MAAFRRRPPKCVLEDLYVTQQISITKIARVLGSAQSSVSGWLASYDIPVRPAIQPVPDSGPSAEELRRMVWDDRITYREIGERFGVGGMTVGSWMKKYGIDPPPRGTSSTSKNKPTSETLASMYVRDRRTAQSIADQFGVEKITALRWLRGAGIARRPAQGLANRGVAPPGRDELTRMIHDEHLSYREIGLKFGVDGAAVGYWVKKHDIERPQTWVTRRRGEVTMPSEDVLRERYALGHSTTAIGKDYGLDGSTIAESMEKYGIERRPGGWQQKWWGCTDRHQVRSSYEQRVDNWLFQHDLTHENDPPLPFGTRHLSDFLVNGVYVEVWGVDKNEKYERCKAWKKAKYAEHGLALIELNAWMFSRDTWTNRLSEGLLGSAPAAPRLW